MMTVVDGKIGVVGEYSVKFEGGKLVVSVALDEKMLMDAAIAKLPEGWIKQAAQAGEAAALGATQ